MPNPDPFTELDAAIARIETHNARVLALAARRRSQTAILTRFVEALLMSAQNLAAAVTEADANVTALEGEAAQTHAFIETLRGARAALQAQIDANATQNDALAAQVSAIDARIAGVTTGLDADQNAAPPTAPETPPAPTAVEPTPSGV